MPKPIAFRTPIDSLSKFKFDGPGIVDDSEDATANGAVGAGYGGEEV
jgi:hypothetical protein